MPQHYDHDRGARRPSSVYPMTPSPGGRRPRRHRSPLPVFLLIGVVIVLAAVLLFLRLPGHKAPPSASSTPSPPPTASPAPTPSPEKNNQRDISVPDWITQDILPLNEWSRPGDPLPQVNGVVIHYVGNTGTTAEQNRSYFKNLAETHEAYASSHFLVGIDGKIIQCVPLNEIAYCSTVRNADTIAIECCHPDAEGKFTDETMASLVKLVDWLIDTYDLQREDVIRHYDVAGKECPIYYVRNPDAWEDFLDNLTFPHP